MALTATMMRFEIELSDVDRGVYTTIELRAAQHPSESDEYLVTRVLAMALEYQDDLTFGRGISVPDDPGLSAPNDMGGHALWIEIGQPSAAKLHKVTKLADRVVVYAHKSADAIREEIVAEKVYRGDQIVVVGLEPSFLRAVAGLLTRNAKG